MPSSYTAGCATDMKISIKWKRSMEANLALQFGPLSRMYRRKAKMHKYNGRIVHHSYLTEISDPTVHAQNTGKEQDAHGFGGKSSLVDTAISSSRRLEV